MLFRSDVMTSAVDAIADMSGMEPVGEPGALRVVDHNYFRRISAIEFTIAHDDGRAPEDLTQADIVLLGVSRSSKTPLSIYLSQQGYKVANVPLDPSTEPPAQIFDVDRTRLFGLMITPEVLISIRQKRIKKACSGRYSLRVLPTELSFWTSCHLVAFACPEILGFAESLFIRIGKSIIIKGS